MTIPSLTKTTNKHPNSLLPSYPHTDAWVAGPPLWDMWSSSRTTDPEDCSLNPAIDSAVQQSPTTILPPDFDPEFEASLEAAAEAAFDRMFY